MLLKVRLPALAALCFALNNIHVSLAFSRQYTDEHLRCDIISTGTACSQTALRATADTSSVSSPKRRISRGRKLESASSLLAAENDLHSRGYPFVVGSDDSGGGGCLAGPVVVASCCLLQHNPDFPTSASDSASTSTDPNQILERVNDSKALTFQQRQEIYDFVISRPDLYAISVSQRSAQEIDDQNILKATMEAFKDSIETLVSEQNFIPSDVYAIVDGKKTPMMSKPGLFPVRPYVNGDASVYCVALASVVAKVTRDSIMDEMHNKYPEFGFDLHRGYGTRDHVEAIHRHGPCPIHRLSFKQVRGR